MQTPTRREDTRHCCTRDFSAAKRYGALGQCQLDRRTSCNLLWAKRCKISHATTRNVGLDAAGRLGRRDREVCPAPGAEVIHREQARVLSRHTALESALRALFRERRIGARRIRQAGVQNGRLGRRVTADHPGPFGKAQSGRQWAAPPRARVIGTPRGPAGAVVVVRWLIGMGLADPTLRAVAPHTRKHSRGGPWRKSGSV